MTRRAANEDDEADKQPHRASSLVGTKVQYHQGSGEAAGGAGATAGQEMNPTLLALDYADPADEHHQSATM
jgi:hypothetical protein